MYYRTVTDDVTGRRTTDGAGVRLVRVLGDPTVARFDPFLMLDAFDSRDPQDYIRGFPLHPHRGIETFTYLAAGRIDHKDSLGNAGSIRDGGCQWMTAGSGILHEEMPRASERMLGLQLWVNLPRRDKMAPPQYRDITADQVPVLEEDAARVAVVAGRYNEVDGAARGAYVAVRFLDVTLRPGKTWSVAAPPEDTLFAYFMEGEANLVPAGTPLLARHAYLLGGGDTAAFTGGPEGARLVLVSGAPAHEPGLGWPYCHEYRSGIAAGLPGTGGRQRTSLVASCSAPALTALQL